MQIFDSGRLIKVGPFQNLLLVQHECFSKEVFGLEKTNIVQSKSKLIGVLPFLDSYGIMRAKGRLRKSDKDYQTKHPIILHSQQWAVKLSLEKIHKIWHHEAVE